MSDSTGSARPRAVLYLRQSIAREESISLELQEAAGREYCRQHSYEVVAVESDPGISGRTWKRPAVQRAMALIEERKADVIVLWKWSRLSRARLDWAIALDKVESFGGRIESATEPLDTTTASGRFARGMLAEFAAFESERIGETWKETIHSRQRRGVPGTGGRRFGYIQVAKDRYEPDPETGPVLAELYGRAARGASMISLAEWLNREGVATSAGGQWTRSRVRPLLDSGFGAGYIAAGVGVTRQYHDGIHEAVVPSDVWDQYLERRKLAPHLPQQNAARYPLTGIIVCGDCGSKMSMTTGSSGGRTRQIYGCNRYQKYRTGRFVTTGRDRVEEWVREQVVTLSADTQRAAVTQASQRSRKTNSARDAATLARRVERLDSQIARAFDGWTADLLTDDEYTSGVARYREERSELLARQASLKNDDHSDERLAEIVGALVSRWDELSEQGLRSMLAALVEHVTVTPPAPGTSTRAGATFALKWRFPV